MGIEKDIDLGPADTLIAKAWAMMGGLDWTAFPVVCAVLGVDDPEWLLSGLLVVKGWHGKQTVD